MHSSQSSPSDSHWSRLESVVQRLEEGWQSGVEPDLEELLSSVPAAERREITSECVKVDMEYRWRNGQPIHLEMYLDQWPDLLSDTAITRELLESECLTRVLFASPPSADELRARFPDFAAQIDLEAITEAALIDRADINAASETTNQEAENDTLAESGEVPPLILLGARLGRYQIVAKIGTGGQGDVYRAVDGRLGRNVALKLLRDPDAKLLERFIREPQFAASVEHRSICRIYDTGTIRGMHFIAMELIEGETVYQRLQSEGPFGQQEAANITKESAAALSKVHTAGIIHRDIKSGNIMIDQEGVPVLMDFGLARPAAHSQGMNTTEDFVGTLAFMSPEQAGGYAPDHRSDIYSLGAVLYQMLTGEVPFGLLPAEFFKRIGKSPPPSPQKVRRDLDRDLDTICRKAMAVRPNDRYQSADEMVDALERYLDGRPQVLKPPQSRRQTWAILTTVVLLLSAVAGAFVVHSVRSSDSEPNSEPNSEANSEATSEPRIDGIQGPRQVDRWIETPGAVHSFAVDANAERLFVADSQLDKTYPIREFDIETGQEIGVPIPFGDQHMHNQLLFSPDERYLFTTNFYFEYISRIDLEGSREPLSIRIIAEHKQRGDAWRWNCGMALTPDGTMAVIPMGNDGRSKDPDGISNDQLAIVDLSADPPRLLAEVPLEDEPWGLSVEIPEDENAAYLTTAAKLRTDVPKVYRVELQPPYSMRTLSIPDGVLKALAISTRLNRVYIADAAHRWISVVNRSNFGTEEPTEFFTPEDNTPESVALDERHHLLAVLCSGSQGLRLLDAVTGRELARYSGLRRGCGFLDFSADHRQLFVACNSSEGGVAVIPVPEFDVRIAFSSDRAGGTDQIYTMNIDGTDVKPLFEKPSHAQDHAPTWSPDGRQIAFNTDRSLRPKVCIASSDGKQLRMIEDSYPLDANGVTWSPQGDRIAYVDANRVELHVIDVETAAVSVLPCELPPPHEELFSICWETDTSLIVTAQPVRDSTRSEVLRLNTITGKATALTDEQELESSSAVLAMSRDGRLTIQRYLAANGPATEIYLFHADMPPERMFEELTEHGPPVRAISRHGWCPSGEKIIFSGRPSDRPFQHLFILDAETKTYRQITSGAWNDTDPNVSPPLPDAIDE